MTASMSAGAVSHAKVDWHTVNWRAVYRNVRRLQARIVKAIRENRWGKVKALQHLITHSFSGRVLAVRRVTENQGKRTPGVDQTVWDTPEKKAQAVQELTRRGYQAQPLRRVYIPKSDGQSQRALGIPVMKDRAQQALYLLALDPLAETTGDPNSYGFRKERSPADAIGQCFNIFRRKQAPPWILEGDIRRCFDEISHGWMLQHIPIDKAILQQWLKAGFMEKHVLYPTEAGTPQGGIISPALMNLTLDGLERKLRDKYPRTTRLGQRAQVHLVRYADDFIITSHTKERLEEEVQPLVEQFLKERGLELSPKKTKITHLEDGFDFLGQNLRRYPGKLLIKPSQKSVKAVLTKIRGVVKGYKQATAGNLIGKLNPIIRGWANYHRHVVSKEIFGKVDSAIFRTLWQWAKRRHSTRSRRWIKTKYFKVVGPQHWVFQGFVTDSKGGEPHVIRLFRAAQIPIQRHIKIQSEANPYDRTCETYFEKRADAKMLSDWKERRNLLRLWLEQNGICPLCRQKITKATGWNNHHIVWRVHGGGNELANRILLHPTCHSQVHSRGITVEKPRLHKGVRKA